MKTFQILGLLMAYPTRDIQNHMDELIDVLGQENLVRGAAATDLIAFMRDLANKDLIEAQEQYVALFDRGRGCCLHMFEHVHGESRDRGQAMIDLTEMYEAKGFVLEASELPDYLPLFLEFLTLCNIKEAQELLGNAVHIVATIGARLGVKDSTYRYIFDALETLTDVKVDPEVIMAARNAEQNEDDSLERLDKEWEEAPAFDGAGDPSACSGCDLNKFSGGPEQQAPIHPTHKTPQ